MLTASATLREVAFVIFSDYVLYPYLCRYYPIPQAPQEVYEGALVMLRCNLSTERKLCNGSLFKVSHEIAERVLSHLSI